VKILTLAKRRKFSSDVSLRHAPEAPPPEGEGRRRQASSKVARQRDRGEALAAGTRRGGEGAGERHVDGNHFVHGAPEQGKKKVMRLCWADGRCVNERLMNVAIFVHPVASFLRQYPYVRCSLPLKVLLDTQTLSVPKRKVTASLLMEIGHPKTKAASSMFVAALEPCMTYRVLS